MHRLTATVASYRTQIAALSHFPRPPEAALNSTSSTAATTASGGPVEDKKYRNRARARGRRARGSGAISFTPGRRSVIGGRAQPGPDYRVTSGLSGGLGAAFGSPQLHRA